jgi:hypothetical protein
MSPPSVAEQVDSLDFGLEYDGPALTNHEMDVRDLAPALLSAGELFQAPSRLVHPAAPEVQVNIRAADEGSFLLQLKILYDHTVNVLGNRGLDASEGLSGLLTTVVGLILYIRKRARAGEPDREATDVQAIVRLIWPDGTVLEVPASVLQLADNPTVRRPLAEVRPDGDRS